MDDSIISISSDSTGLNSPIFDKTEEDININTNNLTNKCRFNVAECEGSVPIKYFASVNKTEFEALEEQSEIDMKMCIAGNNIMPFAVTSALPRRLSNFDESPSASSQSKLFIDGIVSENGFPLVSVVGQLSPKTQSLPSTAFSHGDTAILCESEVISKSSLSRRVVDGNSSNSEDLSSGKLLSHMSSGRQYLPSSKCLQGSRPLHTLSDSDESNSSSSLSRMVIQRNESNSEHDLLLVSSQAGASTSSDVNPLCNDDEVDVIQNLKRKYITKVKAGNSTEEKEKKKQERDIKLKEKVRSKALKQATADAPRINKPGECLKYVTMLVDETLISGTQGEQLAAVLELAEMQYKSQAQPVPMSITWIREVASYSVDEGSQVQVKMTLQEEAQVLLVWPGADIAKWVKAGDLSVRVRTACASLTGKRVTLVIHGLEAHLKMQIKRGEKGQRTMRFHQTPQGRAFYEELETALAELQLFAGVCYRLAETHSDLATLLAQFTKAVAETTYKQEKQRKCENLAWFAVADSRDCVHVDKAGNGLLRLWVQQLRQFNLAGLDTAEAIACVYPSPVSLLNAYQQCLDPMEAELLLQGVPVRRGAGPLTSSRRVGPELSRKLHTFFTAMQGDSLLT